MEMINQWQPEEAKGGNGEESFQRHCMVCHGAEGRGDGLWADQFERPPANLVEGPFPFTGVTREGESLSDGVARVVKFGVPGTDMPGHEWLEDDEIVGLAALVLKLREERKGS
jgi:cytochrome c oxidase cbb3-type subunit 2